MKFKKNMKKTLFQHRVKPIIEANKVVDWPV